MGKQGHPRQRVVLIFSAKPDTPAFDNRASLAITVYPVRIEGGKVRNITRDDGYSGPLYLADLGVRTWASEFTDGRREPWGCQVRYQDAEVETPERAMAMARTLRAICAHTGKLSSALGSPTTFGGHVGRLAAAIGAKQILTAGRDRGGWSHDDMEYQWHDVGTGVRVIDYVIHEWIAAGAPKSEVS